MYGERGRITMPQGPVKVTGKQLASQVLDVTATNFTVLALNLITGILSARLLGPSGKGLYYAVSAWTGVLGTLAVIGLPNALVWFYKGGVSPRPLYGLVTRIGLVTSGVTVIAGALFVWQSLSHLGSTAVMLTWIGLALLPLTTLRAIASLYLSSLGNFGFLNRVSTAQTLGFTVGLLVLAALSRLSSASLVWLSYSVSFLAAVAVWIHSRKRLVQDPAPSDSARPLPHILPILLRSLSFFVPTLAALFNAKLDQMLSTIWLPAYIIGLYGVANSTLNILGSAFNAFSAVFFPRMAQESREDILRRTQNAFRIYVVVATIGTALVLLASRWMLLLAYGRAYLGATVLVYGLAPVAIFSGLIGVLYQGFSALGKPSRAVPSELVGALAGAALLWLWVPRYGGIGAALANSVSYALDLIVCLGLWKREGGHLSNLVPRSSDIRYAFSATGHRIKTVLQSL